MPTKPDDGSAYHLPEPTYDADLTRVERGTPMGELLRRYWHPVGLASDATARPRKVRILGEDLILFRDGQGRAGLVYPRCCHRGTTLYYGKVEERGIRCCYHGWLFDVEGHCLDMPVEPEGGGNFRRKVRQPWYPVEERYGLIFAYLGPPERKPLLPRFDVLEELGEDEFVEADYNGIGTGGAAVAPCNWLQHFENVMDPLHVPILQRALYEGDWKYVAQPDGFEELYNLGADPFEMTNLAGVSEHAQQLDKMRAKLLDEMRALGDVDQRLGLLRQLLGTRVESRRSL